MTESGIIEKNITHINHSDRNYGTKLYRDNFDRPDNLFVIQSENSIDLEINERSYSECFNPECDITNCSIPYNEEANTSLIEGLKTSHVLAPNLVFGSNHNINFRVFRSTVLRNIEFLQAKFKSFEIDGSTLNRLTIEEPEYDMDIHIHNSEFLDDVIIDCTNCNIELSNITGKKLTLLVGAQSTDTKIQLTKNIEFSDGVFIHSINKHQNLDNNEVKVKKLSITSPTMHEFKSKLKVHRLTCEAISIINTYFSESLYMSILTTENLEIMDSSFSSSESSRWSSCYVKKQLSMISTDFGNTSFIECYFNEVKKLNYVICNLSTSTSLGTLWPDNCKKLIQKEKDEKAYYQQIYKFHENEKDIENQLKFKALLLNVIRQNTSNKLHKFTLWLGYKTSNHCTDWAKVLKWILGTNSLFLLVIYFGYDGLMSFRDIATFINPVHLYSHYSFSQDGNITGPFHAIDTAARFFNGYLYYNFVKSLRTLS